MKRLFMLGALSTALSFAGQPTLDPLVFVLGKTSSAETLSIKTKIPKGWHLTSNAPKSEFQIPMEANLSGAQFQFGKASYPTPVITPMPSLGFDGSWFVDSLEIKFPIEKAGSNWQDLKFSLYFQACTDVFCIAPRTDSTLFNAQELQSKIGSPPQIHQQVIVPNPISQSAKVEDTSGLWGFLLLAFLGGMILNLMPCVLPVLGLKIFSLIQHKESSRRHLALHALSFVGGTLSSFWLLASVMVMLKSGGRAMGWGFQFQEPGFVLFMALVVGVFALNLLGLFEVSLGWKTQTALDKATRKEGLWGAFWGGAFMTLLATPCTAPMLSPAMAFAFSQSDVVLFVFMSVVGLGLAFPYGLVCLLPSARQFFPKPGDWMVRLKEGMGYLLLLTLVWLLYTFGQMCGNYALSLLLVLLVGIAISFWIWKALPWCSPFAERTWPKILTLLTIFVVVVFFGKNQLWNAMLEFKNEQIKSKAEIHKLQNKSLDDLSPAELYKKAFDPVLIQKLNAKGIDVFVDFTADWCISCHANEKIALQPQQVDSLFQKGEPVLLIGDYTHEDALISAELKRFGRSGVPMYVLYRHDGTVEVLPEVITPEIVLTAIDKGKK